MAARWKKCLTLPGQGLALRRRHAECRLGQIASHGNQTFAIIAVGSAQRFELVQRFLAHQAMNIALARQQFLKQMSADEACSPGHEICHGGFPSFAA